MTQNSTNFPGKIFHALSRMSSVCKDKFNDTFTFILIGPNFTCALLNAFLILHYSVHSREHIDGGGTEADLYGGFEFCSLLDEELDIVSRDSTCR